jgi:hypothetical protein
MMVARSKPVSPISKYQPLIIALGSFIFGWGLNALTVGSKLEQLTVEVTEMRNDVKANHEHGTEFKSRTNSRLSALEVKVFGQVQQSNYIAWVVDNK